MHVSMTTPRWVRVEPKSRPSSVCAHWAPFEARLHHPRPDRVPPPPPPRSTPPPPGLSCALAKHSGQTTEHCVRPRIPGTCLAAPRRVARGARGRRGTARPALESYPACTGRYGLVSFLPGGWWYRSDPVRYARHARHAPARRLLLLSRHSRRVAGEFEFLPEAAACPCAPAPLRDALGEMLAAPQRAVVSGANIVSPTVRECVSTRTRQTQINLGERSKTIRRRRFPIQHQTAY